MISEQELYQLKQQLDIINNDLLLYSEEEHLLIEQIRSQLRTLITQYGATAELALLAVSLEMTIRKALS